MVKTIQEKVARENFYNDIINLSREILVLLNNLLPYDNKLKHDSHSGNDTIGWYGLKDNSFQFIIDSGFENYPISKPNVKFEIRVRYIIKGEKGPSMFVIPVTNNEIYTKKELEMAKNSIFIKLLDVIKKLKFT